MVSNRTERLLACFSLVVATGVGGIATHTEVITYPDSQNLAVIPKRSPILGARELEIDEPNFMSQIPKNRADRRAQEFGQVRPTYLHKRIA